MLTLYGRPERLIFFRTGGSALETEVDNKSSVLLVQHLFVAKVEVVSFTHSVDVGSVAETGHQLRSFIILMSILSYFGKYLFPVWYLEPPVQ